MSPGSYHTWVQNGLALLALQPFFPRILCLKCLPKLLTALFCLFLLSRALFCWWMQHVLFSLTHSWFRTWKDTQHMWGMAKTCRHAELFLRKWENYPRAVVGNPSLLSSWVLWSMSIPASLPKSALNVESGETGPLCDMGGGKETAPCPCPVTYTSALPVTAIICNPFFHLQKKGTNHFPALLG